MCLVSVSLSYMPSFFLVEPGELALGVEHLEEGGGAPSLGGGGGGGRGRGVALLEQAPGAVQGLPHLSVLLGLQQICTAQLCTVHCTVHCTVYSVACTQLYCAVHS